MNNESKNVTIELCNFKEGALKFTFNGNFSESDATLAAEEWRELFASSKGEKTTIIWNTLHMEGFESKALSVWQKTLKELKGQIDCIWLVTNSNTIKAGAKLMSVFSGYKIRVASSFEEIGERNMQVA